MIRKKLSLRRPIAVIGAATVGLAAAVALSSPASAHHTALRASVECVEGEWVVTWKVRSQDTPPAATHFKLVQVDAAPAIDGIAVTPEDADPAYPYKVNKAVTGVQRLPGTATETTVKVRAAWNNGFTEWKPTKKTVKFEGECNPSTPPPTTAPPTTAPPTTPPATTAPPVTETPEPEPTPEPGEPDGEIVATCDEFIFTVKNPAQGETVTITFTPSVGEPQTLVVEPGETKSVKFPASEGLTVTPSAEGEEFEPVAWEQPEECAPGGGGGLPQTGVKVGGIAGGALALLAIGAVLFFVARRRRTTFTA